MTADSVKRWRGHEGVFWTAVSPQPSNNLTEVLEAAVRLSDRYITGRFLPEGFAV